MMFALCTAVTRLRPFVRAWSNANAAMRDDAFSVMIFRLSTTPGTIWCSRVEILRVLADDHQIDVREARLHAGKVLDRPEVRVQIQRLAQADVDAREALRDRRRDRAFESDLVAADRIEQRARQRLAVALERGDPRVVPLPVDVDSRGFEDPDDGRGHFGADSIAGDQRDCVAHWLRKSLIPNLRIPNLRIGESLIRESWNRRILESPNPRIAESSNRRILESTNP
jgi:hypothetical protein